MSIRAESADGMIHEFPDGTDPAVIDRAMKAYATQQTGAANGLQEAQGRPAQVASQPQTSWLDEAYGFTNAARNALMFNTADEVGAGIGAAFGQDYDTSLANQRAQQREYATERPVANVAASVAGTVPLMFLPGGAARAPTVLGSMARGAGVGAGIGAASGFGAGEGGLENRAKSAAAGGTLGGVIGGAAVPVAKAASPLVRVIGRFASDEGGKAAATNADDAALALIARKLGQDSSGRGEKLADTIARMRGEIDRLGAVGKDNSLAVVGGQNTRQLGKTVGNRPGGAGELIETRMGDRIADAPYRMQRDVDRIIGEGKTAKELRDAREAITRPLYQTADESGAVADIAPILTEIDAKLAKAAGAPADALRKAKAILLDNKGRPRIGIDELHQSKLAIDDAIEKTGLDTAAGRNAKRELVGVQEKLLEIMDKASPEYEAARAAFRSASPAIEASETLGERIAKSPFESNVGRRALNTPERIDELRGLVPPDKAEAMIQAARDESNAFRAAAQIMPTRGSATARNLGSEGELSELGQAMLDAPLTREGLIRTLGRFLSRGPSEEVGLRTADILTRQNPNSEAVQRLADVLLQSANRSARQSTGSGVIGGQLAAIIANHMNGRK